MRTIRYRFTGKPGNLDDCVHHAFRHPLESIHVLCFRRFIPTDITVHVEFVARFQWKYDHTTVLCNVVCGAYRRDGVGDDPESAEKQARTYLQDILERYRPAGYAVVVTDENWNPALSIPETKRIGFFEDQ